MVEVICTEELLSFDFSFPTTPAPALERDGPEGPTGTESVFQIVHQILTRYSCTVCDTPRRG